MSELQDNRPIPCWIWPARVLACLNTNRITILVGAGLGMADGGVPVEVESSLIPVDLRMPNSDLLLLVRKDTSEIVKVLRVGDEAHDSRFVIDMN